ncbi:hypothetical protein JMJ35_010677 [Cladonia borealis]|uniref:Thioester reductase (TE) domain-containing protein n=1 Tax=Cladonia borealis TaxID=184061 RepID=A0AA39QQ01_9LECA|nr:hypothetical protein JMJ35_010677 [Cladonia borealis]
MACQIDQGLSYEVEADAIDWDKETALPHDLPDQSIETTHPSTYTSPKRNANPKVVVLTGATGQLGRALLDELIAEPLIDHVHCIGVRKIRNRNNLVAFDKNKVTVHEGDLVLPDLGLSEDVAAAVFGAVHAVIHNGADMSYLKTGRRSVPFHYVSTVSVGNIPAAALANSAVITAGTSDDDSAPVTPEAHDIERSGFVFRPVSVAKYPPPSVVSSSNIARTAHGYVATKWASEVFLEHLHERYPDWPIVIHRPTLMVRQGPEAPWSGHSKEEVSDVELDLRENLRQYSSLLHAIPIAPAIADKRMNVSGAFDIVSLSEVAREMVDTLRRGTMVAREERVIEGVRFFHHNGGMDLPLDDLRSLVARAEHHEDVGVMDLMRWARKAGDLGMHSTMIAIFERLAAAEGQLVFPRIAR